MFGAPVVAGRTFTAAEDGPNGGNVVVLSYGLWKSRFGGNSDVVGRTIQLDGQPYLDVVGVIGRGFVTDPPGDLWLPYQFDMMSRDMDSLLHRCGAAETWRHAATGRRSVEACGGTSFDECMGMRWGLRVASVWCRCRSRLSGYAAVAADFAGSGDLCAAELRAPILRTLCWRGLRRGGGELATRAALGAGTWADYSTAAGGESGRCR